MKRLKPVRVITHAVVAWFASKTRKSWCKHYAADFATQNCNISPTNFSRLSFEDTLVMNNAEDEFVFFSAIGIFFYTQMNELRTFSKSRFLAIIAMAWEAIYGRHPRHLNYLRNCSKGNWIWQAVHWSKKAVNVWALANQETFRQTSDRFDITMSSVPRCVGRVVRALVKFINYSWGCKPVPAQYSDHMYTTVNPNTNQLSESSGRDWIGSREKLGLMNY